MHGDDTLERFEHAHGGEPGSIEPLDHFVLVEPVDDETETHAGLIIPASSEASCVAGVVVAVGEDVHGVAPGDKVLYPRGAGFELAPSGEPKRLIDRRELIARITD
jgi:co-chaperonin GroES (HSP10)